MQYKFVRNRTDYLKFLESIREDFKCEKYFEDFFGVKLKCDEETGEILEEAREYLSDIDVREISKKEFNLLEKNTLTILREFVERM